MLIELRVYSIAKTARPEVSDVSTAVYGARAEGFMPVRRSVTPNAGRENMDGCLLAHWNIRFEAEHLSVRH